MKNVTLSLLRRVFCVGRAGLAAALLLGSGLAAPAASAQVARYVFSQGTRPYAPLGSGSTLIALASLNPNTAGQAFLLPAGTIPFPFVFNSRPYTGGYVHNSGYMTFGSVPPIVETVGGRVPPWWFHPISEPTGYEGAIAPFATDFIGGASFNGPWAEMRYQTLGTAPSRVFVVQWKDMTSNNAGGSFNFQLRLHETTNAIEFAYGPGLAHADGRSQVGLRGSTTNDFINRSGFWNSNTAGTANTDVVLLRIGNVPANGLLYTYTPGAPQPCPQPFSLRADELTPTTARLNWRVAGGTGPYTVRYGPVGFDPAQSGAGFTATAPAGAGSVTVSGLSVHTAYDFYVTQNCGGPAGNSPISNPKGNFMTTLGNDDPPVATSLPVGATCVPTAGTTLGANTTPPNGYGLPTTNSCNFTQLDYDVWYRFTTAATGPASQTVTLTTTGTGAQKLMLFSSAGGAAGPFTTLACRTVVSSMPPSITYGGLTPGTTYYVLVAGGARAGAFTICATYPPGCGDPLNAAVGSITPTTAQLTFTASTGNPNDYTVTLTPTGGTATTVTPAPTASPVALTNLTPGTSYTLTLRANCGTNGQSAVITRTFTTRVFNDEPAGAIALPLTATCQPLPGTVNGATNTGVGSNSLCVSNGAFPDVWYTFTTDATGPGSTGARIELSGGITYAVIVATSAGGAAGPFTTVDCTPNTGTTPAINMTGLTPSTTYYVRVWAQSTSLNRTFTICARHPVVITCDEPLNLAVSNLLSTSARISWMIPGIVGTPVNFVVTYTPQGGSPVVVTPAPTASPATLSGLQPGTNYTVTVQSNCGAAGLSTPGSISFRTPGPPANDQCSGAIPIACGQTLNGSCTGATTTGEPATLCNGRRPGAPGVWYVVQGTGQTMTLRTCLAVAPNPPYMGTQLFVFTGSCAGLSCLSSSVQDLTCRYTELAAITFATQPGQPYYVLVSNPFGQTRDFTLSATCTPLATPEASLSEQVSLFPNPAHHTATLRVPAALSRQTSTLELYNSLGQRVQQQHLPAAASATATELRLSTLAAGVYSLRLETSLGVVVKRLVVE